MPKVEFSDDEDDRRGQVPAVAAALGADGGEPAEGEAVRVTFDRVTRIIEIVVGVFVGAALVVVGLLQYGVYSQQAAIMLVQNRAFVSARPMHLQSVPNDRGSLNWLFSTVWENGGVTPTKNLSFAMDCWNEPQSIMGSPEKFHRDLMKGKSKDFIGPHAQIEKGQCILRTDEISIIQAANMSYYFSARVEYDDILGGPPHITERCLEITPFIGDFGRADGDHTFQAVSCPVMNCADDECRSR